MQVSSAGGFIALAMQICQGYSTHNAKHLEYVVVVLGSVIVFTDSEMRLLSLFYWIFLLGPH